MKLFKKPKSKFCWFDFTVRGRHVLIENVSAPSRVALRFA